MTAQGPPADDPRVPDLRDRLLPLDSDHLPTSPPSGEGFHAAVSLILRAGPGLDVLLIRRSESETDPWSGHMALPGGRRDASDPDLLFTALRETREETGVRLDELGTPLGRLEPVRPSTFRLPPISIFPFVFCVGEQTRARVASPEIVEVLWAPLSVLREPGARGTATIPLGDTSREFPCFRYRGRVIWGLTYRILSAFFARLPSREGAADFDDLHA